MPVPVRPSKHNGGDSSNGDFINGGGLFSASTYESLYEPWGMTSYQGALALSSTGSSFVMTCSQLCASSISFAISATIAQQISRLTRVSCATPVMANLVGISSCALASVAAGEVYETFSKKNTSAAGAHDETNKSARRMADAILGCTAFVMLGGRFRKFLMSDVRFVGANAKKSIPAVGSQYANSSQKAKVQTLFEKHGCHTCGTKNKSLGIVADHQPPNKHAYGTGGAEASGEFTRRRGWLAPLLPPPPKQRYFPQCKPCSTRQSSAVAYNKQVLVYNGALALAHTTLLTGAAVAASRMAAPEAHERAGIWLRDHATPAILHTAAQGCTRGVIAVRNLFSDLERSLRRP